jgi:hypothetical protein
VRALLLAASLLLLGGPRLAAQAVAVEGVDEIEATAVAGLPVAAYENLGYRLEVDGERLRVTAEIAPLGSTAPFALPPAPAAAAATALTSRAQLARAIAAGATTRYQAVSQVLGWVSRNVEYSLDRTQPQEADAVLARRSGYCTGIARLTVALLAELAIEAREVPGYVLPGRSGGAAGFHRWIEVSYPDRGWVFSDPLSFHHYVPARYVRLAASAVPEAADAVRPGSRRDELVPVDVYPPAAPGVRARKNTGDQLAAALRVVVARSDLAPAAGTAVLEGRGYRRTRALEDGASTFLGLEPGAYTLRLQLPGKAPLEQQVQLPGRVRHAVVFRVGAPGDGGATKREETR